MTLGLPCHADHRERSEVFADGHGARIASGAPSKIILCDINGRIGLENVNASARFDQLTVAIALPIAQGGRW